MKDRSVANIVFTFHSEKKVGTGNVTVSFDTETKRDGGTQSKALEKNIQDIGEGSSSEHGAAHSAGCLSEQI